MKLCFIISSLGHGGAERVITNLANYFAESGYEIYVFTLFGGDHDFYHLNDKVKRVVIGNTLKGRGGVSKITSLLGRIFRIRTELKKHEITHAVGFVDQTNVLLILSSFGLRCRVVVSERIYPEFHKIPTSWSLARKYLYHAAYSVVVQTADVETWIRKNTNARRVDIIVNPINITSLNAESSATNSEHMSKTGDFVVGAAGRLHIQKGFDLLINAFERVLKSQNNITLIIVGEGPERQSLERLIVEKGLELSVKLAGLEKNIEGFYRSIDIFVASSRFEGYPNVLLEAMACGAPVISSNCISGPSDIVVHGKNGFLYEVNDVGTLAKLIIELANNEDVRRRFSYEGKKIATEHSMETVADKWLNLLIGGL